MRRSLLLTALLLGLAGLALAQPPVPMFPAPGFDPQVPLAAAQGAADAADAATSASAVAEQRKERVRAELEGLRGRRVEAEARLKQRARALYRLHHGGSMPVAGGFTALLSRAGRLARFERALVEDARRLGSYRARERALAADLRVAEAAVAEANRTAAEASARQAALDAQFGYADPGFGALPPLPVAPMPSVPSQYGNVEPAGYAPTAAPSTSGFGLLRGRLGLPLTTSIGIRDAVRDDGPGLEFLARPGTTVMSVAEGRVAYAAEYGSYGRMVILDHGDTFYTIYAGLGRIAARVGDYLPRGGAIGDVAGGANPALFFEVRRGTRSLDTRNWLGM